MLVKDLAIPSVQELPEAIKAASNTFEPIPESAVIVSRSQLGVARAQLERLLARSPSAWEAGWKDYLRWEDMEELLGGEEPDAEGLQARAAEGH